MPRAIDNKRKTPRQVACTFVVAALSVLLGALVTLLLTYQSCSWSANELETQSRSVFGIPGSAVPLLSSPVSPSNESSMFQLGKTPGVAMNVIHDSPHAPANLVGLLANYIANLPPRWPIQLFVTSRSLPRLLATPGVARLVVQRRVVLTSVPPAFDMLGRRELMLSPWVWRHTLAEAVIVFDGTSALCSNTPASIEADFLGRYDWVGAAWKWAKPGSPHEWGGNGALSLRNRTLVLKVLEDHIASQGGADGASTAKGEKKTEKSTVIETKQNKDKGDGGRSSRRDALESSLRGAVVRRPLLAATEFVARETRFAMFKGNEDMWFIRKLVEMRDRRAEGTKKKVAQHLESLDVSPGAVNKFNNGHERGGAHARLPLEPDPASSIDPLLLPDVRLASRAVSMAWATEELFDEHGAVPVGVYHTMRSMSDDLRSKVLKACPEAKRLFDARHERGSK